MNYNELNRKLEQIKIEDFIWIIYIGIIALSFYSNSLEEKYYLFNDNISKEKYRKIMIFIFSILIIVYLYFVKDSLDDYKNLKENDSLKKKKLVTLSLIGSLLIALSGVIFLYIAYQDEELDVELAFN
ncbi:MAG: hypothetical protein E7157_01940 [Lactobacillales bacterium]|nr:hypothetical protein [Lactobacillales bacterium]